MTETRHRDLDRSASGRTMASGITYLMMTSLGINACLFLVNLALIRVYGQAVHGGVVWIISVASIALGLGDLGVASAAAARSIARGRASDDPALGRVVAAWIVLQIVLGVVAAAVLAGLAGPLSALRDGVSPGDLRIAAAWVLGMAGLRACVSTAIGFEAMRETLLMSPVSELLRLLVVIAAWLAGAPIVWVLVAWAGCYALAAVVGALRVRSLARRAGATLTFPAVRLDNLLASVREALPYYVPFLGMFCLPFTAQILVGKWWPTGEISIFQVCFSLAIAARLFSGPIATAILPRVAHIDASHADHTQTGDILQQSARLLGTITTGLFAGAVAVGPALLTALYGPAYAKGINVLLMLIAFAAVDSYAQPLDHVLKATRHVRIVGMLEAARYAIILALAWWAIPTWGPLGAAGVIFVASLATVLVKMWATRRLVSSCGTWGFLATAAVLAMLAAVHMCPYGRYIALPAWLAGSLAVRLLRPREIVGWTRIICGSLRAQA